MNPGNTPFRRSAAKRREILRENVGFQFLSLRHSRLFFRLRQFERDIELNDLSRSAFLSATKRGAGTVPFLMVGARRRVVDFTLENMTPVIGTVP